VTSYQPALIKSLQHLLYQGPVAGLDDSQLLERFVTRQDEAAFAALVALHGPLVLGVCRRVLRDEHEIEDAFQATFLVLVRRAGSIRDAGRLGPWLHGVARRVALRSRSEAARRRADHRQLTWALESVAVRPARQTEFDDVIGIIDEEVARLPGCYRDAVVLCDLEGRSYTEAASRLRCPLGTVQSRLARGRARLRSRLIRRGLAPLALESFLIEGGSAAVPDLLARATVKAAIALAAGKAGVAGAVSVTAFALASSAMRSMSMAMMRRIALAFAAVSIAIGVGLAGNNTHSDDPATAPAPEGVQPPPAEGAESGHTVTLVVSSSADGSPLAGATVWVRATRGRVHTWEGTTDDMGEYVVVLPGEGTSQLDVVVAHPGYAPGFMVIGSPGRRENRTMAALERAETVGGTVRDERGLPIEGARVFATHQWHQPPPLWPEIFSSPNSDLAVATTDAQGRWRSDSLPTSYGPEAWLKVLVTHPDFIATELRTTAEKARAFSIEQVMKTGVAVSGAVLSPLGRPVVGATVVVGIPLWEKMFLRFTTDKNGQFRSSRCFDPLQSRPTLTVQAPGLAIAAQTITVKPDAPPLVVRLTRRRPIEGRVVDVHGRPVVGAAVLPSRNNFRDLLDWEADTDSNGRFVWYDAPSTGAILLDVSKPTFGPVWARAVDPAAGEVTITLRHPQHLHGSVTDAETGRPIERFTLIHSSGPSLPGARPAWNRDPQYTRTFTNGQFDLSGYFVLDEDGRHSVLIEAEGYQPDDFVGLTGNVEDVAHDFKLRKATPFSGIVHSPDGRPLTGAEVALDDIGSSIHVSDGGLSVEYPSPSLSAKTDLNGRYSLPSRDRGAWIVVVHKAGFALRSPEQLAGSTDITVAPWGRIEGVMKIEGLVAPSERIWARLNVAGFGGLVEHRTRTDQNGCFTFEQVPPGVLTVGRAVPVKVGASQTLSNPVTVELAPGQTARVQVDGTGRPAMGWPDRPATP
jgi:RNA polymerase sigma factor (sigma-70 family)